MSFAIIIGLALAIAGPAQDNGDKEKGKEEALPCADAWMLVMPFAAEVALACVAVVESITATELFVDAQVPRPSIDEYLGVLVKWA